MFRFSIRDVLWLTVVVGLGLGWWLDHRASQLQIADERVRLLEEIGKAVQLYKEGGSQTIHVPPGTKPPISNQDATY